MVEVVKITEKDALEKTALAIKQGKVILYPTDTVYGIGGDATSHEVVAKIYKIKHREGGKPLSVAFSDFYMLSRYIRLDDIEESVLKRCLPGPYTFIARAKVPMPVTPTDLLGIRIPDHDFTRDVIAKTGVPLIATSANISGHEDAFTFGSISKEVLAACDLAIDGGQTKYKQSSTVIDLARQRLLRKGAGRWE